MTRAPQIRGQLDI